jgi:CheY-like chemotaxis protein
MTIILLVEPDGLDLRLCRLLAGEGCAVLLATDGHEAVSIARGARPKVIVLDLGLAGADEGQVTNLLGADEATSRIPIIRVRPRSTMAEPGTAPPSDDDRSSRLGHVLGSIESILHRLTIP